MSTKATIAYDKNFHLYEEMGDPNHIYFELETNNYEAGYGRVMIPIPVHIWEVIREFPGVRLELASLSDAQLREKVEKEVSERTQRWKEAKKRGEKISFVLSWSPAYGEASNPRAKQIRKGLGHYRQQRKWEREVKAAIEKLRWENSKEGRKQRIDEHNRKADAALKRRQKKIKTK